MKYRRVHTQLVLQELTGIFMPKFPYIAILRKGVAIKFEKKGGSQNVLTEDDIKV